MLLLSFLFLFIQSPVYYVSPFGSDSNPGTESQPFRTVQRAANIVNPGDTVIVEDGVYTGANPCFGVTAIVCVTRGGTSTAKVTFKSRNKWGAVLDGVNNSTKNGFQFGVAHYVRIEGFEIKDVANGASGGASGIELYNGGQGSEIVANHIHDIGRICTDTTNGQNGIFVEQPNVLIEKNLIHDIGRFAPGENGCSPTKPYYQNNDHGIYLNGGSPGASEAVIRNNIFYNIKRGWAIQVYPGTLSNWTITHNTFAFENPYRNGHILVYSSGTNNKITNNIFYDPLNTAIYFASGTQTNMLVSNNITFGGTIGTKSGVTFSNNQDTDPLLVAPLVFDFHLQSNSPAINAGVSGTVDDFDGNSRDVPDIGAYEYGGAPPDPTPTPTPTPEPTPTPNCTHNQVIGSPPRCYCTGRIKGGRCKL